jgi:hypothetical protein
VLVFHLFSERRGKRIEEFGRGIGPIHRVVLFGSAGFRLAGTEEGDQFDFGSGLDVESYSTEKEVLDATTDFGLFGIEPLSFESVLIC